MDDAELADEIMKRLNELVKDDDARKAIGDLCLKGKVEVEGAVVDHPTIQIVGLKDGKFSLGFLGALNGLVGSISGGEQDRCGYVAASFNKPEEDSPVEDWELYRFERFDK